MSLPDSPRHETAGFESTVAGKYKSLQHYSCLAGVIDFWILVVKEIIILYNKLIAIL